MKEYGTDGVDCIVQCACVMDDRVGIFDRILGYDSNDNRKNRNQKFKKTVQWWKYLKRTGKSTFGCFLIFSLFFYFLIRSFRFRFYLQSLPFSRRMKKSIWKFRMKSSFYWHTSGIFYLSREKKISAAASMQTVSSAARTNRFYAEANRDKKHVRFICVWTMQCALCTLGEKTFCAPKSNAEICVSGWNSFTMLN